MFGVDESLFSHPIPTDNERLHALPPRYGQPAPRRQANAASTQGGFPA